MDDLQDAFEEEIGAEQQGERLQAEDRVDDQVEAGEEIEDAEPLVVWVFQAKRKCRVPTSRKNQPAMSVTAIPVTMGMTIAKRPARVSRMAKASDQPRVARTAGARGVGIALMGEASW
jgi:hypothetical protein